MDNKQSTKMVKDEKALFAELITTCNVQALELISKLKDEVVGKQKEGKAAPDLNEAISVLINCLR